ncbi:hypothetical protein CPB84DRAFT_1771291, partial [Gymnopilus junonius]
MTISQLSINSCSANFRDPKQGAPLHTDNTGGLISTTSQVLMRRPNFVHYSKAAERENGESSPYKWHEYVPGDEHHTRFRPILENHHVGREQGNATVQARPLSTSPQRSTSLLRRYLNKILPDDLKATLQSVSLSYNPDTGDFFVVMCFPTDKTIPTFQGSEDTWAPGCKIRMLSILLGRAADARHYQVVLWIIHWAHCHFNSTIKNNYLQLPPTCSSLTYVDIEHLNDPALAGSKLIPSNVKRFPHMHTLLWAGDARLFSKLLAKVSSHNLRSITIQSRIYTKDAHYILKCLSKTQAEDVEMESISDSVPPVPAFVRDNNSKELAPVVSHNIETLKLGLTDVADIGHLLDGLYLSALRSLELVLPKTSNPEVPLHYFAETKKSKVFIKPLEVVNIVCDDSTMKHLDAPVIGREIKKCLGPTVIQFRDLEGNTEASVAVFI